MKERDRRGEVYISPRRGRRWEVTGRFMGKWRLKPLDRKTPDAPGGATPIDRSSADLDNPKKWLRVEDPEAVTADG